MGGVNGPTCEDRRGALAMLALHRLDGPEAQSLEAHLTTCVRCRVELAELSVAADALAVADADHVHVDAAPPDGLIDEVVGRVRADEAQSRRSYRLRVLAIAASIVVVVSVGIAALTASNGPARSPAHVVTLTGQAGRATVALTAADWGTAATLTESGAPVGEVLTVRMATTDGVWWVAGSYQPTGRGPVVVHLSCGVAAAAVSEVWVTSPQGRTVLSGYAS